MPESETASANGSSTSLIAALNAELEQWVGDDNTMILRNALRKIIREAQEEPDA